MIMETQTQPSRRWSASFFTIWTGQAFSLLGSQLVQFALIWWLTKTTGSATVLATASLAGLLPQIILGPVIGTFVDRWNRRLTMILADSTIALATFGLALLFLSGRVEIWHVYLLMFIRSTAGGYHWVAMQASTSLMVPKEHLARIQGLNQMLQGGMNIVSAPLGALLLDMLSIQGILFIDIATAAMAITPLFFIAVPQPEPMTSTEAGASKNTFWQDFRLGLSYMFGWTGLMIIALMATLINLLLNPAGAMLPILVTRHFIGGAMQLAGFESTLGIGVIVGGIMLSIWGGFRRRVLTSMVGVIGIGMGSILVGFAPPSAYLMAVAGMFMMGFALPITNGPLMAAVQAVVAPEMQGRVFTLINSAALAMTPLGLILAAPVVDHFGAQSWYIMAGFISILMALTGCIIPAVMNLENGRYPVKNKITEVNLEAMASAPVVTDGD